MGEPQELQGVVDAPLRPNSPQAERKHSRSSSDNAFRLDSGWLFTELSFTAWR